jgi:uncharacterized membrane protein
VTQSTDHVHLTSIWFPWAGRRKSKRPALKAADDDRTLGERVADQVASFGGSWTFIFIFLGLIAIWIIGNTLLLQHALHHKVFDPYRYIALNLVLSALAGLQAPIIMMTGWPPGTRRSPRTTTARPR